MALDSIKKRQDFINAFIVHFFSDKINPKKFLNNIAHALDDTNLVAEVEKHWSERNKEIEEKIYKEYGSNSAKEIRQIVDQKKRSLDGYLRFTRDFEDFSETEVKNWLPADKLVFNQDIFHNRLRGLDLTNMDQHVEKRIISALEKESKGLSRQEVILYYSLIKAIKISAGEEQVKAKKKIEEKKFFQTVASALLGLVYPKRINQQTITEINEGAKIDRETMRDMLVDKIQNKNFPAYPYLILFGIHKSDTMYHKFLSMAELSKYFGENPEKVINYTIFYILFKNADEKFLKLANFQPKTKDFMDARKPYPFSPEGSGMVRLLDTFFYALCAQIYEINKSYQKADDDKKAKIYKLYSSEDRLRMVVQNSLSVAQKVIERMELNKDKVMKTVARYLQKQGDFLKKEDIFSNVFDFEKLMISF
jgi:ferritin-like metal-binding protein YciE